jgi:xanthine dehydrogenase accessory factor
MSNFFLDLVEQMNANRKVVIARIIRQVGSAPRTIGTKCLILEDGSLQGTIGGGALEFQVMNAAQNTFKQGKSSILYFQLTGKEVAQTDMLCGGKVDVYLEPLDPGNRTAKEIFEAASDAITKGNCGILATLILEGMGSGEESCRAFITEDGALIGGIEILSGADQQKLQMYVETKSPALIELEAGGPLVFVETVEPDDVLYLFGAGHVSTFIAPLAKMVGFHVVVIDDREEFANKERFPSADEILSLPFLDAFERITVTPSAYFAIVTRGHIYDHEVLRYALRQSSGYIGMIGSKRKRDLVYQALMEEGFSKERLQEVHSPIGLEIGAETPEEIAISIVGELVKERAAAGEKM